MTAGNLRGILGETFGRNHLDVKLILDNRLTLPDPPTELATYCRNSLRFPNPKWEENQRLGRWNQGVPRTLTFYSDLPGGGLRAPRGFIRKVILKCRGMGIPWELDDRRPRLDPVDFAFAGELKPFQVQAVATLLPKEFGTLSAPTGGGKTVIGLKMIAERRQPALVVVHTRELAHQWVARIETFLGIPEAEVGFIGEGRREVGERITVALVQSLYKCAEAVAPRIGFLMVDECHRAPSRTFTDAVSAFDCRYMLGLTATPWRRDKLSRLIFLHLGDVHWKVEKDALEKEGHIVPADVVFRETDFRPFHDPAREYSKMIAELVADDARNRMIAADIAKEAEKGRGVCLVLSDRKHHCENLVSLLRFAHKAPAELLTGDVSPGDRREIIDRVCSGGTPVIVATGQLVGEGFDCPNLTTLFIATPVRFQGRLLQYLGRVLRPAPGKTRAKVYDYVDVHVGPLVAAARARQRAYRGEELRE